MQLDAQVFHLPGEFFSGSLSEIHTAIDHNGFVMDLDDVAFRNFHLTWGRHSTLAAKELAVKFDTSSIVSHFRLSSEDKAAPEAINIYHQAAGTYKHAIPETEKQYVFFELSIAPGLFEHMFTTESRSLEALHKSIYGTGNAGGNYYTAITPAMRALIHAMRHNSYQGHLRGMYLEAKAMELFLLQVQQLDRQPPASRLKPQDIECLHEARRYIEQHYNTPCSIIDLARKVGINQMKLKNGFRELFGTTVFGYLRDLQMEKARQLLLEEKLYVSEVADRIGYKHAHHFAAAFKKKFGILPGELKR